MYSTTPLKFWNCIFYHTHNGLDVQIGTILLLSSVDFDLLVIFFSTIIYLFRFLTKPASLLFLLSVKVHSKKVNTKVVQFCVFW